MSALPASASASSFTGEEPRIAMVCLMNLVPDGETAWLAACYQLTPRVARLTATSAALDLGFCTEQEALTLARHLADRLRWNDVPVRIGIGPTPPVAQLALLTCPASQRIALVASTAVSAFLKPLPISLLDALVLPISVSEETVLRLRCVGVRTLGQLARLDELTMRRQFGAVGALLAALARGDASSTFHSTPPEPVLRFRTRFSTTLSMDQTLRRLPELASEIATRLCTLNQTMGALTLTVWWAAGGVERIEHTLPEPTHEASVLTQRLASLLLSLARPQSMQSAGQSSDIERLDVRVTRLAPLLPQQRTLWSTPRQLRSERRRRIAALAETLTQRHHRPLLLAAQPTNKAATFSEDRYRLTPLSADALVDPPAEALSPAARQRTDARQVERLIQPHWW